MLEGCGAFKISRSDSFLTVAKAFLKNVRACLLCAKLESPLEGVNVCKNSCVSLKLGDFV